MALKLGRRIAGEDERLGTGIGSMLNGTIGGDSKIGMPIVFLERQPLPGECTPGYAYGAGVPYPGTYQGLFFTGFRPFAFPVNEITSELIFSEDADPTAPSGAHDRWVLAAGHHYEIEIHLVLGEFTSTNTVDLRVRRNDYPTSANGLVLLDESFPMAVGYNVIDWTLSYDTTVDTILNVFTASATLATPARIVGAGDPDSGDADGSWVRITDDTC